MYDSHCHLDDARFDGDRAEVLARAFDAGVTGLLLAGVDAASRGRQRDLARTDPRIARSFGVHPMVAAELDDAALDAEIQALEIDLERERPSALGETGLDRRPILGTSLPRQERAFRAQLGLAERHELPVVLHIVRAHDHALGILEGARLPAGGVVHSFSGSAEIAKRYLALGFHISFCGTVTFPEARKVHAAVKVVPIERLLVETDAPDQTPMAHRPGRNEPGWLGEVVEAVARLRGDPVAAIREASTASARELFRRRA